jgi:pimeloyl-ACP methyl ester carboxylesterase
LWYQYYFNTPRGREGLAVNRYELGKLLWQLWSPSWKFDEATYVNTAKSFENPDFVDVAIHSYRHRFGYAPGEPALEEIETALSKQPKIAVPTITLCGADDGVSIIPSKEQDASHFLGHYEYRMLQGVGHNIPQEAPDASTKAILDLMENDYEVGG